MVNNRRYPPNLKQPRTVEGLYPLERILSAVADQEQCRLLVVSAPAGFGKTALALCYVQQIGVEACWFTLDPSQRDGGRFLNQLALAMHRVFPQLDLETLPAVPAGVAFTPEYALFVEELTARIAVLASDEFVLVLDAFHAVQDSEAVVRSVDLLLQRLPAGGRILLLSRTRPVLPSLPRLVTYGQAIRLSAQDLAFTEEETAAWLQASELQLNENASHQLWAHYEGWIAGMALVAFQADLSGGDLLGASGAEEQDWFDYLETEVYQTLPLSLQEFLSGVHILAELDPGVCDGLLETANALDQLKALADTWQLIQRVGRSSKFRWSVGLRRFLVRRLREQGEAQLNAAHGRAGKHFLSQEDWEAAVHHFCEARQPEQAAAALQAAALGMYTSGAWVRLGQLTDLLPASILDRYPLLLIYRARCAAQTGDGETAFRLSSQVLDLLHEGPAIALAQAHVARAAAFRLSGLLDRCVQECDRSIALLTDSDDRQARMTLAESYHYKGTAYNQGGRLQEAGEALEQALTLYRYDGDLYHVAYAHHHLGSVYRGLGEFGRSASHYREAEGAWRRLGNRVALASTLNNFGNLLRTQGRLQAAEEVLGEAARNAEEGQSPRVLSYALSTLGEVLRHLGQHRRALTTYRQGAEAARSCSEHQTIIENAEGLALSYLALGDFMTARLTIEEAVGQTGSQTGAEIRGRLLTSQSVIQRSHGLYQEARRTITQARQLLEQSGSVEARARCAFHYAALLWAEREPGVQPLVQEIVSLLTEPGSEAVLLADARLSLPFVQQLVDHTESDSVLHRLLTTLAELPGEPGGELTGIASETQPLLRVYGFGNGAVERTDQQPSRVRWANDKAKELFFYLVVRNGAVQKEDILQALWPETDPAKADTQFWAAADRLRTSIHPEFLLREDTSYRVNPTMNVWFDVVEFEDLVHEALRTAASDTERASKLQRALNLYQGSLLRECASEWPELLRGRLEDRYLAALLSLAQIWAEKGVVDPVVELCDRALATNPYHAEATCLKIEALGRAGRLAEAEATFEAHAKVLSRDLQEEPGERVTEVYRLFVRQKTAATPLSAATGGRMLATVLFSDIVRSTEIATELGDRKWHELLYRHHAVIRRALARHGGWEVKTLGDGFLATFTQPAQAIQCAREMSEMVREVGLEIRVGLHTGECEVTRDDVGGIGVHIAARVMSQAGAGEVLVSSTVKDLVVGSHIEFEDRGNVTLKGVSGEWRLFSVTMAPSTKPLSSRAEREKRSVL